MGFSLQRFLNSQAACRRWFIKVASKTLKISQKKNLSKTDTVIKSGATDFTKLAFPWGCCHGEFMELMEKLLIGIPLTACVSIHSNLE